MKIGSSPHDTVEQAQRSLYGIGRRLHYHSSVTDNITCSVTDAVNSFVESKSNKG